MSIARAAIWLGLVGAASAATCPFNVPVVTLPPQQVGGYNWGPVIRPMNDACVDHIAVEPTNASAWYVGGAKGLYMTKNAGQTWTHPLSGQVRALLLVPGSPPLVYVGVMNKLYLSRDRGKIWTALHTFQFPVQSLLVANGTLWVGLAWSTHAVPSGVFISNLGAGQPVFHPFGPGQTGLIVWTLSRDPQSGTIYAGTEIFDHPQPYHPPFFRSTNGGVNWTNVAGILPTHVIASAVRPNNGLVYALTEGESLYTSANQGNQWTPPANAFGPSNSLLMDPNQPTRLFGGRQKTPAINGGIFVSTNSGQSFQLIGREGVTIAGIAVNGASTRVYATAYGSGIYTSPIP